jgi:hypothetical protein
MTEAQIRDMEKMMTPAELRADLQRNRAKIAELEEWKASAMGVMNGIDIQAVGQELGIGLGEDIGPKILPGIRALKLMLESRRDQDHGK